MNSKNGALFQPDKHIHMFYYDGTAMTFPSVGHGMVMSLMEQVFESLKKDLVYNGLEVTTENIKAECEGYLEKINTQLLATEGDELTFKKLRRAWGKDAAQNEVFWCAYVWILENKCGVPSSNTFGYMGMGMDAIMYEEMVESKVNLKCGNPSCDHRYPSMKKCSACKNEHYCSAECQKTHWKIHKKVCDK
jgi:hypothetical protein